MLNQPAPAVLVAGGGAPRPIAKGGRAGPAVRLRSGVPRPAAPLAPRNPPDDDGGGRAGKGKAKAPGALARRGRST